MKNYNDTKSDINDFKKQIESDFDNTGYCLKKEYPHSSIEIKSFVAEKSVFSNVNKYDFKTEYSFLPLSVYQVCFSNNQMPSICIWSSFICYGKEIEYLENTNFNLLVFY